MGYKLHYKYRQKKEREIKERKEKEGRKRRKNKRKHIRSCLIFLFRQNRTWRPEGARAPWPGRDAAGAGGVPRHGAAGAGGFPRHGAAGALVERFDRRGTEPFELFTPEFGQNSVKIQCILLTKIKKIRIINIYFLFQHLRKYLRISDSRICLKRVIWKWN